MRVFCQLTLSVVTVLFGSGEITRGENWVRGGTPARQGGSALTPYPSQREGYLCTSRTRRPSRRVSFRESMFWGHFSQYQALCKSRFWKETGGTFESG